MFRRIVVQTARSVNSGLKQSSIRRLSTHPTHAEPGAFVPPHVNPKHKWAAEVMGTIMWLWIFYRAKEDGAVLIVKIRN